MPTARRAADQRRHERTDSTLAGSLTTSGHRRPCLILDISAGGARIEVGIPIDNFAPADLAIGAFEPISGELVWARGDVFGLRFSQPAEQVAEVLAGVVVYG
jgi:hypothetical protein